MSLPLQIPDSASKSFALDVVRRLREAGFEALWAGGCVRDALLGIVPSDYDVATSARPDDVIRLFGERRTVAVGASFGVVVVTGRHHKEVDQVEVATFRSDGRYSDGRRPDSVHFCSAEEDAQRRDFTINGMFYDPVDEKVVDYVGGQEDLAQNVIRAIGVAEERFTEDKLRMLRAARFTARYGFTLDDATADAIRRLAGDVRQVSVERITQELRRMLSHLSRHTALDLLVRLRLFPVIFPMVSNDALETASREVPLLTIARFEPSLSVLLQDQLNADAELPRERTAAIADTCRLFRLSREETSTVSWLCDASERSREPHRLPLHDLKPILADERRELLMDRIQASVCAGLRPVGDLEFLQAYLERVPVESLNPAPLVSGADLTSMGLEAGPEFSRILNQIRDEQLDERISSRDEALRRVNDLR